MKLEKLTLPTYSAGEEIFNAASHALGSVLGLGMLISAFLIDATITEKLGLVIMAVSMMILYTSSTVYHSLKRGNAKKVMRLVDHSVIYILITGSSASMMVAILHQYSPIFTYVITPVSLIIGVVGVIMTVVDHEKYANVKMILYVVSGSSVLVLFYPIYKYCNNCQTILALIGFGCLVYLSGIAFYKKGAKIKNLHGVFHVLVIIGTIAHCAAIYVGIMSN